MGWPSFLLLSFSSLVWQTGLRSVTLAGGQNSRGSLLRCNEASDWLPGGATRRPCSRATGPSGPPLLQVPFQGPGRTVRHSPRTEAICGDKMRWPCFSTSLPSPCCPCCATSALLDLGLCAETGFVWPTRFGVSVANAMPIFVASSPRQTYFFILSAFEEV